MSTDIYKIKYIKYKKKYDELKKLKSNINEIIKKIIIVPKEYNILSTKQKKLFQIYETDKLSNPISWISVEYFNLNNPANLDPNIKPDFGFDLDPNQKIILDKEIILPDEYFLLSDSNKAQYEIFESDYEKFPNRVVPKNYKKI